MNAVPPTRLSVLVVNPCRDVAEGITLLLVRAGHKPVIALRATSAVKLVRECPFDLLICASALPDGDGFALLPEARTVGRVVRGFAVASDVAAAARSRADATGFERFFPRPFDVLEFLKAVDQVAHDPATAGPAQFAGDGFDPVVHDPPITAPPEFFGPGKH